MNPKILVTGATGTIGKATILKLTEQDRFEIHAFIRNSRKNRNFAKSLVNKVHFIYGDISKKTDVDELTSAYEAVIHLAAIIPPNDVKDPDKTRAVNYLGTKYLIDQVRTINPGTFFLYASSVAVYGDRLENPNIRVGDPTHALEFEVYAQTKIDTEKMIMSQEMDWTIFRLSAIIGAANHRMSYIMFHMPLATPMEISSPEECANAFVYGLDHRAELTGKIFNLSGGKASQIQYKELLEKSFHIYGLGKLNFPEHCFAEKNFHCGYFTDGDDLEAILAFRMGGLEDYFHALRKKIPNVQRWITYMFRRPIKYYLSMQSQPLKAHRTKDHKMIKRFFKDEDH